MDGISCRASWYASAATCALPAVIHKRLRHGAIMSGDTAKADRYEYKSDRSLNY